MEPIKAEKLLEIVDRVENFLIKQGEKSYQDDICRYRTDTGLKCALGCLISDEAYNPDMENHSMDDQLVINAIIQSGFSSDHFRLLQDLQYVHDRLPIQDWPVGFNDIRTKINKGFYYGHRGLQVKVARDS